MKSKTFRSNNVAVVCDYAQEGDSFASIEVRLKTFEGTTIIAEKRLVDSSFPTEEVDRIAKELLEQYSHEE